MSLKWSERVCITVWSMVYYYPAICNSIAFIDRDYPYNINPFRPVDCIQSYCSLDADREGLVMPYCTINYIIYLQAICIRSAWGWKCVECVGMLFRGSGYWLWLLIRNNRRDKVAYRQADLRGTPGNKPQEAAWCA